MAGRSTMGTVVKKGARYRARYERNGVRHTPGRTFSDDKAAWAWLRGEQSLLDKGTWTPPAERRAAEEAAQRQVEAESLIFRDYALTWIEQRTTPSGGPLSPRTRSEYRRYVDGVLAEVARLPMNRVTRAAVKDWWQSKEDVPRLRHHGFAFAKSVFKEATKDGIVSVNPWDIDNAARVTLKVPKQRRASLVNDLEPEQVAALADAMPPQQRALILVLAWTGLRPGEAVALQRRDITQTINDGLPCWRLQVQRAVSYGRGDDGSRVDTIGRPKTEGSIRQVWLPPHVAAELEEHLERYVDADPKSLVFPSGNPSVPYLTPFQINGRRGDKKRRASGWNAARQTVGVPALRLYDLRHWARRMLLTAGMGELLVEQYMGHRLPAVQGSYSHVDPKQVWPIMVRCSELAGERRPTSTSVTTPPASAGALAAVLNALDDATLAATLSTLDAPEIASLIPALPPARIAAVLASITTRTAATSGQGEPQ